MRFVISTLSLLLCAFIAANAAPHEFVSQSAYELGAPFKNKHHEHKFHGFPKSYEMEYIFSLPYTTTFQPVPIKSASLCRLDANSRFRYTVHYWIDAEDHQDIKSRVDSADGLDSTITTKEWQYISNPRMNDTICTKKKPPKPHGSRRLLGKERGLPHDMTNWTYMGEAKFEGQPCRAYELKETFYERTAFYELYIGMDGNPLYLSALGQNYFTGAHFDQYTARFTKYVPGVPDASLFEEPEKCRKKPTTDHDATWGDAFVLQMNALVPTVVRGHPEYDEFAQTYSRAHGSPVEYEKRMNAFLKNKIYVEEHNRNNGDGGYQLVLNHFADWADKEFFALKTGGRQETPEVQKAIEENTFVYSVPTNKKIPKAFSWIGTKADGPIKDQAVCGSCWAFAAVQALEGQWFIASNQTLSFSEQQINDCSWTFFNWACEGGFPAMGMLYVVRTGGISSEFAYSYQGYDDYCKFDKGNVIAKFKNIGVAKRQDRKSIQAALMTFGPLAISIDAGHLDFRFYKSGIYSNPKCESTLTNHAVALMGWGRQAGTDYWLIKNSWSTFWGDKGYMKVDMKYDCGITNRAVFAIADEEAVAAALKREHHKPSSHSG